MVSYWLRLEKTTSVKAGVRSQYEKICPTDVVSMAKDFKRVLNVIQPYFDFVNCVNLQVIRSLARTNDLIFKAKLPCQRELSVYVPVEV